MNETYTTRQGQTWDLVSKEVYGNEKYIGHLMKNNTQYIDVFIFSAGTVLNTPKVEEENAVDATLPEWRK